MSIQDIPLDKLSLSPQNVRPQPPTDHGIAELAASIQHHGLQQNLVVIPKNKREKTFAVIAGGRRLAALKLLAEEGNLHPKAPIPCRIELDKHKASEQSLAENTLRLNMNPADACAAFQNLITKGNDVEDIARNFGVTVRFIKQRLALASLAEPIMDALRSGDITLDTASVFADCPDQTKQATVFAQARHNLSNTAWVKRLLSDNAVSSTSRLAKFVGEEAYVAAGGTVTSQLFEDDRLFHDSVKLEDIALQKISDEVRGNTDDLGLSEVISTIESHTPYYVDGMQRLTPRRRAPTEAEQSEIDDLEAQLEDLHGQCEAEDLGDEAFEALSDQIDGLEKDLHLRETALEEYDPELKAQAIAYAFVNDAGDVVIDDRLFVPAAVFKSAEKSKSNSEAGEGASTDIPRESAKLLDDLAEHRALVLAAGLAQAPELANDIGRFEVIVSTITTRSGPSAFALKPRQLDQRSRPDLSRTIAAKSLWTSLEALNDAWLHQETYDGMFSAFQALPKTDKAAWFGFAVAHSAQSVKSYDLGADLVHAHVFEALDMTEADWWRPTVENYFGRIKKADCLAIAEEIGGSSFKSQLSGLKKSEIAQALEDVCSGKGHLAPEDRERALAWMPEPMCFGKPDTVPCVAYGSRLKLRGMEEGPKETSAGSASNGIDTEDDVSADSDVKADIEDKESETTADQQSAAA